MSQTPPPVPRVPPAPPLAHTTAGNDAVMRMLLPVGRSVWAIAAGYLGLFAVLCVPAPLALLISIIAIRARVRQVIIAA